MKVKEYIKDLEELMAMYKFCSDNLQGEQLLHRLDYIIKELQASVIGLCDILTTKEGK